MIKLSHVAWCSLLALPAVACKKAEKPGNAAASAAASASGSPTAGAGAADSGAQQDLKAELAGKSMAPLYGVAQPDPAKGNSHRLTFSTRPLTCATLATALADAQAGDSFWIRTHEALRPDGTTTWAYGGIAFGDSGSAPAGLVAMSGYQVEGARVTGTLPGGVSDEGSSRGTLAVSGSFSVPVCEPLPIPRLRDLADRKKDAVPIEAAGSTARVTVAGKSFDLKGATALPGQGGTWEVRLTASPHGCSDEVPGDLIVGLRIGDGETKLYLGGNWIPGSANVVPIEGTLKVDAAPGAGALALTLAGAMDYTPSDAPYAVALSGTVNAKECPPL